MGTHEPSVNVVTQWPGETSVKVPSEIAYKDGVVHWGFTIPPDVERLQWFKLLLLKENERFAKVQGSKQLKAARQLLEKLSKSAVDVVADYLGRLWECALVDIRKQEGSSMDGMPFRIVLTVPANWPLEARDEMRKAAQKAGLLDRRMGALETKLEFVGEPEAAALAAFFDGNIRRNIRVRSSPYNVSLTAAYHC